MKNNKTEVMASNTVKASKIIFANDGRTAKLRVKVGKKSYYFDDWGYMLEFCADLKGFFETSCKSGNGWVCSTSYVKSEIAKMTVKSFEGWTSNILEKIYLTEKEAVDAFNDTFESNAEILKTYPIFKAKWERPLYKDRDNYKCWNAIVAEETDAEVMTDEDNMISKVDNVCREYGCEMHTDSNVVNGFNIWYKDCIVWSGIIDCEEMVEEAIREVESFVPQYEVEFGNASTLVKEYAFNMGYDMACYNYDAHLLGEDIDFEAMLDDFGDLLIPLYTEGEIDGIFNDVIENIELEVLSEDTIEDMVECAEDDFYNGYIKAVSELCPEDWKNLECYSNGYAAWISFDRKENISIAF